MPIAVRRLTAAELPVTLRLSDADSMAGQVLSDAGDVVVSAQLSRNGQPGEANAPISAAPNPVRAAATRRGSNCRPRAPAVAAGRDRGPRHPPA
jgi:cytochrome c-type biogenesis protein CcmH